MTMGGYDPRSELIAKLKNYQPQNKQDREQAIRILDFVYRNPFCFRRTLLEGHITGSAWVVNQTGKKVLLTHHKKLGKWLQLGGHADGESDVLAIAMREVHEESGLTTLQILSDDIFDVDVHLIPAHQSEPAHFHYDIRFLIQADDNLPLVVTCESKELAWVGLGDLERYSSEESLLRMREKWKVIQSDPKPD